MAADDLVQDALERALNKSHLWRAGTDLRAWLFTVMHNVFVNQVRGRPADRALALVDADLEAETRAPVDRLELRDLDIALRSLPAEQREVLLLVALEQLTYEETARVLDIPVGTVMSRLARGRERLRRLLDESPAGAATLKAVK